VRRLNSELTQPKIKMNTLLVPVDFSDVSRFVIAEAAKLARLTQSRIAFLHVVQPPPIIVTDYGPMADNVVQFTIAAEKDAARHLASLKKKMTVAGLATETILRTGYPVYHIVELAKKLAASYIVIGSHGHTAFYDLLIGSTTSGVLKRAPCPVIVIPMHKKKKARAGKQR
jgi:nucleotide-binding universal stress UspA family protein